MGTLYYVYMMRCSDGTFYVGMTVNLAAREARHIRGDGAKFTKSHGGERIVYREPHATYLTARRREI